MNTKAIFTNRLWKSSIRLLAVHSGLLLLGLAPTNSPAQTYTILHSFTGSVDGGSPGFGQLVLSGTTLYGTTLSGGSSNYGTLFRLNTDGSSYTVLKNFTGGDGSSPQGTLALSGSTLFGTTASGGSSNCGTVFKLNTDGSEYVLLKSFTGSDGDVPCGALVVSNATLYGTTVRGGDSGWGTVFKLGSDGSGYTLLKSFSYSSSEGAEPVAGPVLCGNTLYGTTSESAHSGGSIYRVNIDGSEFIVLKVLPASPGGIGADGIWPVSPLVIAGTTLYGTADWGGSFGSGTLLRLNTDGTGFTVLKHFNGSGDGAGVEAGLLLVGTTLYGTTYEGGDHPYGPPYYGHGTVFRINTDGSGFMVLRQFGGSDGANPRAGFVMSGTTLFGTTAYGGSAGSGVIFSLLIPQPAIQTPPQSQTTEIGSTVGFSVEVTNFPAPAYQWFFNDTNAISGLTTNPHYKLTNVGPWNCGAYTVLVSNMLGAVTSAPAMLNVIAPVERRPVPSVKVTGQSGSLLSVDFADSLTPAPNWTPLGSVSLPGTPQYCFDLTQPPPPQRFYRSWQAGTPGVRPSLDLHPVPAITLTGTIGGSVRVDYISQFGPTDAWVTVATVPLTNTSQLYFDISAPGQPPRLYRLVQVP